MQHAASDTAKPTAQEVPAIGEPQLHHLRALVQRDGVAKTARRLGLSRHAVTALLAGARVHAGTLAHARERIAIDRDAVARPSNPPPPSRAA